jgi:hypothetical protein
MKQLSGRNLIYPATGKQPRRTKRATVSRILKTAYRLYFRDKSTTQAVKRCLG